MASIGASWERGLSHKVRNYLGSVKDSCAMTPWRKGAHSSRAIASKALAGKHRTNYIDIQQVVKQSQPASMMTLDKLGPSFTGRICISTAICYASKIERKHITFRTRIKRLTRKTICFSRSILMHDLVIGLFINRYEFGYAV